MAQRRGRDDGWLAVFFNVAMYAMQLGPLLERLTQPELVDVTLGARMVRLVLEDMERVGAARQGRDSLEAVEMGAGIGVPPRRAEHSEYAPRKPLRTRASRRRLFPLAEAL